jgi:DNA-binding XRE family transcriptional regulator
VVEPIDMKAAIRKRGLSGLLDHIDEEARPEGSQGTSQVDALDRYYSVFGQFLQLRRAKCWTQNQLAEASGIDQVEIGRIELGKANPTAWTLIALVPALDGEIRISRRPVGA